jgi:hypothetical protein
MNSKLIRCCCHTHVITFDYDSEDSMLLIAIMPARMTLWQRIKYVFANKAPTTADVVIEGESLAEVKRYFESLYK